MCLWAWWVERCWKCSECISVSVEAKNSTEPSDPPGTLRYSSVMSHSQWNASLHLLLSPDTDSRSGFYLPHQGLEWSNQGRSTRMTYTEKTRHWKWIQIQAEVPWWLKWLLNLCHRWLILRFWSLCVPNILSSSCSLCLTQPWISALCSGSSECDSHMLRST